MNTKKILRNMASSVLLAGVLVGCGGGGGSAGAGGAGGLPAKGPFKEGSVVTAQQITFDGAGNESYGTIDGTDSATTSITSNGKFSISVPWTGVTLLTVKGSYLDENTGLYIPGGLLTAVVDMKQGVRDSNINVNILTHVATKSILATLREADRNSQALDVTAAKDTAKQKVAKTFNIDLNGADLEDLDLTNGEDATNNAANTQLLKLSASLLKTEEPEKLLSQIADDLELDDEVDEEAVVAMQEIKQQEKNVVLTDIATNIESNVELDTKVARDESSLDGKLSLEADLSFTDVFEAFPSTQYESNEILVNGIYGSGTATITIDANGSFSKDGGNTWIDSTTTDATISNGDLLKVRTTASSSYDTEVSTVVTIGGIPIDFNVLTQSDPFVADTKIAPFSFDIANGLNDNGEPLNTLTTSAIKTIDGINTSTPVTITNGQFSINGSNSWGTTGNVTNGDTIQVRHTSSTSYKTAQKSVLTFGTGANEVQVPFVSVTIAQDTIPDDITYAVQYDQELTTENTNEYIVFPSKTISGISGSVAISVENGEYSIDGGSSWASSGDTVSATDSILVRHLSSTENNTKTTSTLIVGRYQTDFSSVTKVADGVDDTSPDSFSFGVVKGTSTETEVTSSEITITGIDAETPISVSNGGEYSLDGGSTWSSSKGTVENNATVMLRHTSSSENLTKTETTLTVGDFETSFVSFTAAPADTTPVPFSFDLVEGASLSTQLESNEITVSGINTATQVSITGGEYSLDDGQHWQSAGTVTNGDTLIVRQTTSDTNNTTKETVLTVGTYSAKFVTKTVMAAPTLGTNAPATSVTIGEAYSFTAQATGATSWQISNKPDWAIFNTVTGVLSGTPTTVAQQQDYTDVTITAVNSGGNVSIRPFTISVQNYAPVISGTPATSVLEDTAYSFTPTIEDRGGDTSTFSMTGNPSWLSIDSATGTVSGTPTNSDVGTTTGIKIVANDGDDDSNEITFDLTVTNVNDAPTVSTPISDTSVDEDSALSFDIKSNFQDIDANDSLSYTATLANGSALPTWISFANGVFTGTPTNDDLGILNITVTATDGSSAAISDTFTLTVNNTNDAPVANDDSVGTAINRVLTITSADLLANDIDVDPNSSFSIDSISALSNTTVGTFTDSDMSDGSIEFTPNTDVSGTVTFTYTIIDENNVVSAPATVTIRVAENNKPVGVDDSGLTTTEDTKLVIPMADLVSNDTDGDNDTLTITSVSNAVNGSVAIVGTDVEFTPTADYNGTASFEYTVNDGIDDADAVATVSLNVTAVNDAPTNSLPSDPYTTDEDSAVNLDITSYFNDVDTGDSLTYTATLSDDSSLPSWLSFTNGIFTGTPTNDEVGDITIKVTATDSSSESISATFVMSVVNVNDAPTIVTPIGDQTATEDTPFSLDITSNFDDIDVGDTLVFHTAIDDAGSSPLPQWLSFNNGVFSGTPTNSDVGTLNLKVEADDGSGGSVIERFVLTIGNTNDAPVFELSTYTTSAFEGRGASGSVLALDDDGDTLTYSLATQPSCGTAVVNTNGTYTYTNTGSCTDDTFTISASDGTASATTNIDIAIQQAYVAVDPYVSNAQFFADLDADGQYDVGEPLSSMTDASGRFTFESTFDTQYTLLMKENGYHMGEAFDGGLKTISTYQVATPMTTLAANGFTEQQILDILSFRGLVISLSDINLDPMSAFENGSVSSTDYPRMQAAVAINTLLRMTGSYGLDASSMTDSSGALISPYSDALDAAIQLATGSINETLVSQYSQATPKYIVYVGIAISNFLVDQVASMEASSQGSGYAYLSDYLNGNLSEPLNIQAQIGILAFAYMNSNGNTFFKLSSDGTQAESAVDLSSIEFTEFGFDFAERKDNQRYQVPGNDVTHDETNSTVTLVAMKSDTTDSMSEIKTEFDDKKAAVQATVVLTNASANAQRAEVGGYMDDSEGSLSGLYAKVIIKKDSISYYLETDTYDANGTKTDTVELYNPSAVATTDNVGRALTPVISVNPSTGVITFTVYDANSAVVDTDSYTLADFQDHNLGFDFLNIRSRVNTSSTTSDPRDTATAVVVAGANVTDMPSLPTATMSSGTTALFSDDSFRWIDIANFGANTVSLDMYENNGMGYAFDESEEIDISYGTGNLSINLLDDNANTVEVCTNSETMKVNAVHGNVYSDLYRTKNTCVVQVEDTESNTWDWDWNYDLSNPLTYDINGLVTRFTDGYTYFQEPEVFMLTQGGEVVLAIPNPNYPSTEGNEYIPGTTVVGSWTSDSDSIDVDLSTQYNITHTFSLDPNYSIVQTQTKHQGFTESDYLWTGSDVMDFFSDVTGLNITAPLSNKQINIEDTDGTWPTTATFFASGEYVESGQNSDDNSSYNCYGLWKEFDDGKIGATCDEYDAGYEPNKDVNTNGEVIYTLNSTLTTGTGVLTIEDNEGSFGVKIVSITDAETSGFDYPAVELASSAVSSTQIDVNGNLFDVRAYSSSDVSSGGTTIADITTLSGTFNGVSFGFAIAPDYLNKNIVIKIFDSYGQELYKSLPMQAYQDSDGIYKIKYGSISVPY